MEPVISGSSIVVAAKAQVSCDLEGEAAILHRDSGVYYGLDPVGARIWRLVQALTARLVRESGRGGWGRRR